MKKNPKKKAKKVTITILQKRLWELCKRIIRARYATPQGHWNCFTCGRLIDEPWKAQTGHFLPSGNCGAFLKYDLRNLRIQCYHCNINLGGNGAAYYHQMVQENGQEYVDQLFKDKQKVIPAYDHYLKLLSEYERMV